MKRIVIVIATSLILSGTALAHDIGHEHRHYESGWEAKAGFVSDTDIEAKLWNPRGKSQEEIDKRAAYIAHFFDAGRTAEERATDKEIRARYKDAIVINSLMPSGVGIQGVKEDKFVEAVNKNHDTGISLMSTSVWAFEGVNDESFQITIDKTDAECLILSSEPYQILKPAIDQYVFIDSAAGGPQTLEAYVTAALSSSMSALADTTAEATTTQAVQMDTIPTAIISIEAAITIATTQATTLLADAVANGAIVDGVNTGASVSADAIANATQAQGITADTVTSATVDAGGEVSAAVSFGLTCNVTKTAEATAEASLTIGAVLSASAVAEAVAEASLQFDSTLGLSMVGEAISTGQVYVNVGAGAVVGATAIADATAEAAITVTAEQACVIIAEAAAYAGITIGEIVNVVVDGELVSGGVISIPDGRMYVIQAETRIVEVPAENRVFDTH